MVDEFEYDVFLSFATADKEYVRTIYQVLISSGLRVFWSDETLKEKLGNEGWGKVIEESLLTSQHFILFSSKKSIESYWVDQEYRAFINLCHSKDATNRLFFILPIHGYPVEQLPPFLQNKQIAHNIADVIPQIGGTDFKKLLAENASLKNTLKTERKHTEQAQAQHAAEFATLTREKQTLKQRVDALTIEIGKLATIDEDYHQLEQQHQALTNELVEYKKQLAEADSQQQTNTQAIKQHQQQYKNKVSEIVELNQKLNSTEKDLAKLKDDFAKEQTNNKIGIFRRYAPIALLLSLITLYFSHYWFGKELNNTNTINAKLESELSENKAFNDKLESELAKSKADNVELEAKLTTSRKNITKLESKLAKKDTNATASKPILTQNQPSNPELKTKSTRKQEKPRLVSNNEFFWAFPIKEEIKLYSKPSKAGAVINKAKWLEYYEVTNSIQKRATTWLKLAYVNNDGSATIQGWARSSDLLIRREALKKDGVYIKAIPIKSFYTNTAKIHNAISLLQSPTENATRINKVSSLFNIHYIYTSYFNRNEGKEYLLIGDRPTINNVLKADSTIIGWVESSKVFTWRTRLAAEYIKTNLNKRHPAIFLEEFEEWKPVIDGEMSLQKTQPLAIEDIDVKELHYSTLRYPIKSQNKQYKSKEIWYLAFFANSFNEKSTASSPIFVDYDQPKILGNDDSGFLHEGWVMPFDLKTNEPVFKQVVLMRKNEVGQLIALLGRLIRVDLKNLQAGWKKALEETQGEELDLDEKDTMANIIQTHMGLPVKSPILHISLKDLSKLNMIEKVNAFTEFKIKLFQLRAVSMEKEIKIVNKENFDNLSYQIIGSKNYWFDNNGEQLAWLDRDKYIP